MIKLVLALLFLVFYIGISKDDTTISIYEECEYSDSTSALDMTSNVSGIGYSNVKDSKVGFKYRERGLLLELKEDIIFDNKKTLLSNPYKESFKDIISYINSNTNVRLIVEGHASFEGSKKLNDQLSWKRSRNVINYLVGHGVDRNRLLEKGLGSYFAEYNGAKDRRVDFVIIKTDEDLNKYRKSVYPY